MDAPTEMYRVRARPGPLPDEDAAATVFSTLFDGIEDAAALQRFTRVLSPGTRSTPHRHTVQVAAGVVSGAVTVVFGADGTGRVELGPGDYLWIRDGVMHDEETADGAEIVIAHAGPLETLDG